MTHADAINSIPDYRPEYSVHDYQLWAGDWELWNGSAVAMTPSPFGHHQHVAGKLLTQIAVQLNEQGSSCVVIPELDWIVSDTTVVRPDIVVCKQVPEKHLRQAPILIVEVLSASTERKDRTVKLELYKQQGVRYYLMAKPQESEDGASQPKSELQLYELSGDGDYLLRDLPARVELPDCVLQFR